MKIISVTNRKGGVGKTSLSINLSYELSRMGYLVLMIDLDSQCDLTKFYLNGAIPKYNVLDILNGKYKISNAVEEIRDNLYLLSGSQDINHYKNNSKKAKLKEMLNSEDLKQIDIVIIDHPPNMSEATLEGFKASDEILIVTDAESFSIDNLNALLEDITAIKTSMNSKLHILGIVTNKVDMRRNLTKKKMKELKYILKEDVLNTYISNNTAVPLSQNDKVLIRDLHYRSIIVSQINNLAIEILERMELIDGNGQAIGE